MQKNLVILMLAFCFIEFTMLTMTLTTKKSSINQDDLAKRLAKLEMEVSKMKKDNSEKKKNTHKLLRLWTSSVFIIISAIFFVFSLAGYWVKTNLTNTDVWVEKTTEVIQSPAVRNDISNAIADAIFTKFDVEQYVADTLPDKAKPLAAPISNNLEGFTKDQINKILQSEAFLNFWQKANRSAHQGLITSLEKANTNSQKNNNVLYFDGDQLMLNLQPIYENISSKLQAKGIDLASKVSASQVDKQIPVAQVKNMPTILASFNLINRAGLLMLIPMLIFGALGLFIANNKRRALMLFSIMSIVFIVLNVQAVYLAQYPFADSLKNALGSANTSSALAIYSIYIKDLIFLDRVAIVIMLLITLFAYLAGPAKIASWIRNAVSNLFSSRQNSKLLKWIATYANAIITALAVVTFLLILFPLVSGPWYPISLVAIAGVICIVLLSIKTSQIRIKKQTKSRKK